MANQIDLEPIYTYKLLQTLLLNDAQLKSLFGGTVIMYNEAAPSKTPDFYLVVNMPSADDANAMDGQRMFSNVVNTLTCVSKDVGLVRTSPIIKRVDDIIAPKDRSVNGGGVTVENVVYVGRWQRINVSNTTDIVDNVRWFYLMAVYETIAYGMP